MSKNCFVVVWMFFDIDVSYSDKFKWFIGILGKEFEDF